jgi:Dolichyl-phosphate-mannose-protein mannosyltransferase
MWTLVLAAALLWPGHGIGLLDGIPLDRRLEAVVLGALAPALWWLYPAFTRNAIVRAAIVLLAVLKLADATLLTQQGWCVRFETAPLYENGPAVQTSWDARADFRSAAPQCSAIAARQYSSFTRFPVWFLNLQDTRPPRAPVHVFVDGFVRTPEAGVLTIDVGGTTAPPVERPLPAGVSPVHFDGVFTGSQWKFLPEWNGRDVFSALLTTRSMPGGMDRVFGAVIPAAITIVSAALLVSWLAAALLALSPTWPMLAWMALAATTCAVAGTLDFDRTGRLTVALLIAAVVVPVPERLSNLRGAFLIVGVPWIALLVAGCLAHAGRISMYSVGDDWTTFQRFAHRIYIQGYWLEGGERGFWQQPLYRWIAGALHVVFGDSSIGEMFLDAAALLVGALFAIEATRRVAGFRVALAAGVLTLLTVAFGPNWYIIGRGLSDAVAAGFVYAAALVALRMREQPLSAALLAGSLATLGFLTRLNYLPLVVALVVLTLPLAVETRSIADVGKLWRSLPKRQAAVFLACIGGGVIALMLRTWHYLGQFSLFAGTTRLHNATGLGVDTASFLSGSAWKSALESVAMIITVQDPPGLNVRAVLVIGGVCCAVLALLQAPLVRRLPIALVLFCLAALSGGFVARGVAYPGRFSLHLIPVAVAVMVSTVAIVSRRVAAA